MKKDIPCPDCGTIIPVELDLLFSGAGFKCSNCPVEIKIHKTSIDEAAQVYLDFKGLKAQTADTPKPVTPAVKSPSTGLAASVSPIAIEAAQSSVEPPAKKPATKKAKSGKKDQSKPAPSAPQKQDKANPPKAKPPKAKPPEPEQPAETVTEETPPLQAEADTKIPRRKSRTVKPARRSVPVTRR